MVWGCWIKIILYSNHLLFQIKEIKTNIEYNREITFLLQVEKHLYMIWSIFFVDNYVGPILYLKLNEGVLLVFNAIRNNLKIYYKFPDYLWERTGRCLCSLHCATVLGKNSPTHICNMAWVWIPQVKHPWLLLTYYTAKNHTIQDQEPQLLSKCDFLLHT